MIEIYNSKEWSALFGGSPNWIIADDGYIYEASEYYNLMTRPCGRIERRNPSFKWRWRRMGLFPVYCCFFVAWYDF